jgi:putative peptidoglycan lipid II flippase
MRSGLITDVVKNSAVVSVLTALGIAAALAVDLATAAYYGTRASADAFFVASTVPSLIASSLLTTVQVVMVPIMVSTLHQHATDRANRIISAIVNQGFIFWVGVAAIAMLVAPLLVQLLAAGASAAVQAEAVSLSRLLFWLLPFTWLTETLKAGLNTHSRFAIAASMPLIANVIAVLLIVATAGTIGVGGVALAYLVRSFVPIPVLFAAYRASGGGYRLTLGRGERASLVSAFRLFALRMGTILLRDSDTLLERFLASFLPVGAIAALAYAQRAVVGMESILAGGVQAALMPDLSRLSTEHHTQGQQRLVLAGMKLVWLVTLPFVGLSIALNTPITTLLFMRGQFDAAAVALTSTLLVLYLIGLPFSALVRITLAVFYAERDARTPAIHMILMLIVNSILLVILFPLLGALAVPLAASVTYMISLVRSIWLLRRRSLNLNTMRPTALKATVAAVIAGISAGLIYTRVDVTQAGFVVSAAWLAVAASVSLVVYLGMLIVLRTAEAKQLINLARRRAMVRSSEGT